MSALPAGAVRVRGVSRRFKLLADRNMTLKETLLRRRRSVVREELWALRNVSLEVRPGEAVGLIGQNGSGKSTLLKIIAGIIPPDEGSVEVGGQVASMLELGAGFHPDFTGRENVYMNAAIHGLSEREVDRRMDEIVSFAELARFIDQPVRTYSSGMQMRLAFAVASHVEPDVLLLDEVLAVGDEAFQRKCMGRIFEYRRRGGTIVFVSHDPAAVERVCDRALLLDHGEAVEVGETHEVVEAYHRLIAGEVDADAVARADETDPIFSDQRSSGTRTVVIRELRVVGESGITSRVMSGEPIAIELDIDPGQARVEYPNVGIAIHSDSGELVCGCNTYLSGFSIPAIDRRTTLRLAIRSLPLHEGRFSVTAAIVSQDDDVVFHWLDRWIAFSVFQRRPGVGLVALEASWHATSTPDTQSSSSGVGVAGQ